MTWHKPATHLSDISLYSNAGINFPVCLATARLLDMDATGRKQVNEDRIEQVTCLRCLRAYKRRYAWAWNARKQAALDALEAQKVRAGPAA